MGKTGISKDELNGVKNSRYEKWSKVDDQKKRV